MNLSCTLLWSVRSKVDAVIRVHVMKACYRKCGCKMNRFKVAATWQSVDLISWRNCWSIADREPRGDGRYQSCAISLSLKKKVILHWRGWLTINQSNTPPLLWLAARGKEEKELCCQSLVSTLTPVGPHHTQLGLGATLLLGGARLRKREGG